MLIPSIDIQNNQAVQLIGGKELALEAGDPRPIAKRFSILGEIAVIDLDAALSQGENESLIRELLTIAPCRVGGGIRSIAAAVRWLDAGATKVILGTAAQPEILRQLPRSRVIAALDALQGEVVIEGWRTKTGASIDDRMHQLAPFVSGFLVTFVESEGRMQGIDLTAVARLAALSKSLGVQLTVAGGVTTPADAAAIDALGADAQVGMALYTNRLDPADALFDSLRSDRSDALIPTVITNEHDEALGLAYSSRESLREALRSATGVYFSRSRNEVWRKGATSGDTQELLRIDTDCDRDTLRFRVRQSGRGFCHTPARSCWTSERFAPQETIPSLDAALRARISEAPIGSYTARLARDPALLASKILEEAAELNESVTDAEATREAADLLYFLLTDLARRSIPLDAVTRTLAQRSLRITRRPGNAKPQPCVQSCP